jgi:hypothetical protein
MRGEAELRGPSGFLYVRWIVGRLAKLKSTPEKGCNKKQQGEGNASEAQSAAEAV